jgi:hypothetical protein
VLVVVSGEKKVPVTKSASVSVLFCTAEPYSCVWYHVSRLRITPADEFTVGPPSHRNMTELVRSSCVVRCSKDYSGLSALGLGRLVIDRI